MRGRWSGFVAGAMAQVLCSVAVTGATTGFSVRSDGDDQLHGIVLETGVATPIGPTGFADIEGLAFAPDGTLFGVDDATDQLVRIDPASGAATAVGPLGFEVFDVGLAFDTSGALWMTTDLPAVLYRIDPATGAATEVGPQGRRVTGLAATCGGLVGLGGDGADDFVTIDRLTGVATSIAPLTHVTTFDDAGLDVDASGTLWGVSDAALGGEVFTIDPTSGLDTLVAAITVAGVAATGFEGLAIAPPPLAAVGPPQTVSSGGLTAPLGATPVAAGGTWSIVAGGTGIFEPGSDAPDARFRHTGGAGPLVLRWTVTGSGCSLSADTSVAVSSQPPTITAVAVAPDPALVDRPVTFTLDAADADGEPLRITWDLGDGSTADGAQAVHSYRATGLYTATATVTDLAGVSTTTSRTVPVHEPLTLTRVLIRLPFGTLTGDTALVTGALALASGFEPAGATLALDLGGVVRTFTLDSRGRGRSGADRVRLRLPRAGRREGDPPKATFVAKLRRNLAPGLADEGLQDAPSAASGATRTVAVLLTLDGTGFWTRQELRWTARRGRAGVAASPRARARTRRSVAPRPTSPADAGPSS